MAGLQFRIHLDDVFFVLFEQMHLQDRLAPVEKYADFDIDLYKATLEEAARVATEVLAPINATGDRQGCTLDSEGNVTTPDGYIEAWNIIAEGGWIGTAASPEFGGVGLPHNIGICGTEFFGAACTAFAMYPGLSAAVGRVITRSGVADLTHLLAERIFTGQWAGTMCLTEADAGSSVGDNRCRATRTDTEGTYHLQGEKIFISGADQDLTENIIHIILARTSDAPAGTKGLSIFMVPKFLFDNDGNLGERNDALVTGIEHKMGLNGSATCTLTLGMNGPCKAWIIGEEGDGISIMFTLMNEARIGVGVQGLSAASLGYEYARSYAKERIQGTAIRDYKNADAKRVPIIEHPDVRRMLMVQKVYAETMRSFLYKMGMHLDLAHHHPDKEQRELSIQFIDLLTPIAKGHCTDVGFDCTVQALQVLGGYGYISEYPVEQLVRDTKIASIYEGTNGIQAMDLIGRKLRQNNGALLLTWISQAKEKTERGLQEGFEEAKALDKAIDHLGMTAMHLGSLGMQDQIEIAMLHAVPFMNMYGTIVLAMEALEQASVAKKLLETQPERKLLRGKLQNLKFFVHQLLPSAIALGKSIQSSDASPLQADLF